MAHVQSLEYGTLNTAYDTSLVFKLYAVNSHTYSKNKRGEKPIIGEQPETKGLLVFCFFTFCFQKHLCTCLAAPDCLCSTWDV